MNQRAQRLHDLARNYVAALGSGDFDAIPYRDSGSLLAFTKLPRRHPEFLFKNPVEIIRVPEAGIISHCRYGQLGIEQ